MRMRNYDYAELNSVIGEELYEALLLDGYISLMSDIDLRVYPHTLIKEQLRCFDGELRAACELFCLGRRVSLRSLSEGLRDAALKLEPSGIVRTLGESICTSSLSLYVIQGLLYFAETPGPLISLYYGEDSIALATRLDLLRPLRGKVLDLCSGPGIQGILAAALGCDVTAVEINPVAASVARCNATLNGCVEKYCVVEASIDDFFSSKSVGVYNRVYANPPLVPVPEGMPYALVGAGGVDGLKITRSIIGHACDILAPGGELITIGLSGGNEHGPYVADAVDSIVSQTPLRAVLSVLSRCPVAAGSKWLDLITRSVDGYALERGYSEPHEVMSAYHSAGISEVYSFALTLIAPACTEKGEQVHGLHRYIDLSDAQYDGIRWWLE